jgi:hypothetical protein
MNRIHIVEVSSTGTLTFARPYWSFGGISTVNGATNYGQAARTRCSAESTIGRRSAA